MPKNQEKRKKQKQGLRRYSRKVIEQAFLKYLQEEDSSYFANLNPREFFLSILDRIQEKENLKYLTMQKDLDKIK